MEQALQQSVKHCDTNAERISLTITNQPTGEFAAQHDPVRRYCLQPSGWSVRPDERQYKCRRLDDFP